MIVVDTSALMAIVLDESAADECARVLATERALISATTLAEALIVAERRGLRSEMDELVEGLGLEVVSATARTARHVADIYARWGKGAHPASLNFGDCFAYDLARSNHCPLLFVGEDFKRTDVASAM